jgi:hypothetical protein
MRRSLCPAGVLAALLAAGVFASSASATPPSYYPSGPQQNVAVSTVTGGGWTQCFIDTYADDLHAALPGLLSSCTGSYLMLAGRPTGSSTLTLLAAAPRTDVLFDTGPTAPVGSGGVTHTANGTAWYFHDDDGLSDGSWGFAAAGDQVFNAQCDVGDFYPNFYGDSSNRLCWHLISPYGGFRLGSTTGLNSDPNYDRLVFESNGGPDFADLIADSQGVGPGKSLADKATAAQSYFNSGDTADACGTLSAYLHEVNAQTGKSITSAQASDLIEDANSARSTIGCGSP